MPEYNWEEVPFVPIPEGDVEQAHRAVQCIVGVGLLLVLVGVVLPVCGCLLLTLT